VFDRILAKGCLLHCAVLDWDIKAVETLLSEVYDVNAVDSGGRNALHPIAAQGPGASICMDTFNSLFQRGATVHAEDMVVQRTALLYEIEIYIGLVRDRLLENNVQVN